MTGINYGILSNAKPLSVKQIEELENQVVENAQAFVYLDTDGKLCFSVPHGIDGINGIKDLAWNVAHELSKENDTIIRKSYVKTGLNTFEEVVELPDSGSLLSEPVTITAGSNPGFVNFPKLGLELGKTYAITYTYGGVQTTIEKTCIDSSSSDGFGIEGCYTLGDMGADAIILNNGEGFACIGDNCIMSLEGPIADNTMSFAIAISGGETPLTSDFILENIVEVAANSNLLSEYVVFETAGHEEMHQGASIIGLVAGKTYKVSALVGASATPFEYEAVAVKYDEDGSSIIQIAPPDDALFNNHLAIWIMDATGEMNGEPINTNIIMISGYGEGSNPELGSGYSDEFFANDTYSPVVIRSITEV